MGEQKQGGGPAERLAQVLGLKPQQANMIKLIAIAIAIGILFLNAGDLFGLTETRTPPPPDTLKVGGVGDLREDDVLTRLERDLADRLKRKLALIQGAGRVEVMVTLAAGPTEVPVTDVRQQETTTSEKGAGGDTRQTTTVTRDVTTVTTDGRLGVLKVSGAEIAGVLIVAEGARDDRVRAALHQAVVTTLDVPAHKVDVEAAGDPER